MNLHKDKMSPYMAGILIGLLQVIALVLVGKMLGLSSSYAAASARILDPLMDLSSYPYIQKYLGTTGDWQLSLAMGIVVGSYLSSKGSRHKGISLYWQTLDYKPRTVYMSSFVGGFLLVFGARLAGGCTSGHGISGLSTFSLGSLVTMSTMFASAIIFLFVFKKILRGHQ